MCKHVLAARLGSAMGEVEECQVSDEHIKDILENID